MAYKLKEYRNKDPPPYPYISLYIKIKCILQGHKNAPITSTLRK